MFLKNLVPRRARMMGSCWLVSDINDNVLDLLHLSTTFTIALDLLHLSTTFTIAIIIVNDDFSTGSSVEIGLDHLTTLLISQCCQMV